MAPRPGAQEPALGPNNEIEAKEEEWAEPSPALEDEEEEETPPVEEPRK